jgi:hypothetical protein
MNKRAVTNFLVLIEANFIAAFLVVYGTFKTLSASSDAKVYIGLLLFFGPFLVYLFAFYRGHLFVKWPVVLRSLAFCFLAFLATFASDMTGGKTARAIINHRTAGQAEKQKANVAIIREVTATFSQRQGSILQGYYDAIKPLSQGRLLDMSNVQQPQEILSRKDLVQKMISSIAELKTSYQNLESDLREALSRRGVSPGSFEPELKTLHTNAVIIEKMCTLRTQAAQYEIQALDLLNQSWGKWTFDRQAQQLRFRDPALTREFNRLGGAINQTLSQINEMRKTLEAQRQEVGASNRTKPANYASEWSRWAGFQPG